MFENKLKNMIMFLTLIISFMWFIDVKAIDKIEMKVAIDNVKQPINASIIYEIEASETNISGVLNEPKEIIADFSSNDLLINHQQTKDIVIDFSNTTYNSVGLYKYKIKEKSIVDPKHAIEFSGKEYEIYVQVNYQDGLINKNAYLFARDLDDNVKKELTYNYVAKNIPDESNNPSEGEKNPIVPTPITSKNRNMVFEVLMIIIVLIGLYMIIYGLIKEEKKD